MKAFLLTLILAVPGIVLAASDPVTPETRDPVLDKVSEATKRQDWAAAAAVLKDAVASNPENANYHNLYA
jgi:hypothetical protein